MECLTINFLTEPHHLTLLSVLFQLSDGVQAAIAGALRGMGRQKLVACLNFIGFWVVGTTLGAVLTFAVWEDESPVTRVAGLWWGLVTGITATSLIGVMYLSQTDWQAEADAAHQRSKVPAVSAWFYRRIRTALLASLVSSSLLFSFPPPPPTPLFCLRPSSPVLERRSRIDSAVGF